jgi:cysteine desulfurase
VHGGGQERGLRSGTLNVPAIVGFGAAAEIARRAVDDEGCRVGALRDTLLAGLRERVPGLLVNGSLAARLPHNLNVSVPGVEGESLAMACDDIAVSAGAACGTGKATPSRVLTAIGVPPDLALASLRFGLGRPTTDDEVAYAVTKIASIVSRLRELYLGVRS